MIQAANEVAGEAVMAKDPQDQPTKRVLGIPSKCWLGGIGALATVLVNALLVDVETLDAYIRALMQGNIGEDSFIFGYAGRGVMLFVVGAFWLAIHSKPTSHWQAFQLGAIAPALAISLLMKANEQMEKASDQAHITLISPAFAQTEEMVTPAAAVTKKKEEFWHNFWTGFFSLPLPVKTSDQHLLAEHPSLKAHLNQNAALYKSIYNSIDKIKIPGDEEISVKLSTADKIRITTETIIKTDLEIERLSAITDIDIREIAELFARVIAGQIEIRIRPEIRTEHPDGLRKVSHS